MAKLGVQVWGRGKMVELLRLIQFNLHTSGTLQKIINCLYWMLAFRRPNEECFCGGTKQEGDFATPFIISNIDQWITSKLQATISINNTLISGSKTLVNSIKKASCVNRHHGADWQCHRPTKGCNGQSEMGVWGAMSSPNTSLPPVTTPTYHWKNSKQTLLAHIWGNKLETNKSKWALRLPTSRFLQSTFPDGNSFPSLP